VDWIHLGQDRVQWQVLVDTVITLQVPWKAENFLISWAIVSFSRRTLHSELVNVNSRMHVTGIVTLFHQYVKTWRVCTAYHWKWGKLRANKN